MLQFAILPPLTPAVAGITYLGRELYDSGKNIFPRNSHDIPTPPDVFSDQKWIVRGMASEIGNGFQVACVDLCPGSVLK